MPSLRRFFLPLTLFGWTAVLVAQDLEPSPSLTPQQVVQAQLDALRHNDEPTPDAGIERTFRFASPSNRVATGPLDHFGEIVKSPAYSPLINSLSAAVHDVRIEGDEAKVLAKVVSGNGTAVGYVFVLSKQKDGEYRDCWMTDGVMRVEFNEDGTKPVEI